MNDTPVPSGKCLECGVELVKKLHESEPRFRAKKFCSASHARAYLKKNKIGWWSPDAFRNRQENYD